MFVSVPWKCMFQKRQHVFVCGVHHCIHQELARSMVVLTLRSCFLYNTNDVSSCSFPLFSKFVCLAIFFESGIRTSSMHTQATASNILKVYNAADRCCEFSPWAVRLRVPAAGPVIGSTSGSTFRLAAGGRRALLLSLTMPSGQW